MTTGVGMGFDLSKLENQFKKLDKQLEKFMKDGKTFEQNMNSIFQNMGQQGLQNFSNQLGALRKNVVAFGKQKVGLKWDSVGLKKYIDDVNRLIYVIQHVQKETKKQGIKGASITGLRKEVKDAQELLRLVKQTEKDVSNTTKNRQQTYSGALRYSANVKNLEQERQAVINLEAARDKLKKSDADYANKLNTLNVAIQKHEQNLKDATKTDQKRAEESRKASEKTIEAQRRERAEYERRKTATMDKYYSSNYSRALKFSTNTKTLEEEARAIKYLEAARAKLNTQDANYKKNLATLNTEIKKHKHNLDEAKKGAQELKDQHKGLLDTSGQLARAMAAVFSVSAIKGYVNKLMAVRGEFELQQRSLQVLLQNKAEANELWDKTVALAVKSPLTTKQLVTSTKQLAAYRIESDKLYETNKMLADVSQGLGVDMNRLILAFGQVKAANFLRGTELRQFSEAGVNMLDELAKRFTALEGRAVSVGEVCERISKRMVTFADVEAVFKSITSKGGTFYQMQEKQSETLKGQMLNLRDQYELMLNDIGQENEGMIKSFVRLMRELVANWRVLAPYIKTAGVTFLTYFSLKGLMSLAAWFGRLTVAAVFLFKKMQEEGAKAASVNPWLALITVVTAVGTAIYQLTTNVDEFEATNLRVNKEITDMWAESRSTYRELADTVNDVTKNEEEREEALNELQSKYKEILPDMYTELEYIKAHAGNYQAAEEAMRSYYNAMAVERKKSIIAQKHEDSLYNTDIPELTEQFKEAFDKAGTKLFTDGNRELAKLYTPQILNQMAQDYVSGDAGLSLDIFFQHLNKQLGTGTTKSGFQMYGKEFVDLFNEQWNDYVQELEEYANDLLMVRGLPTATKEEEEERIVLEAYKKNLEQKEKELKSFLHQYREINNQEVTTQKAMYELYQGYLDNLGKDDDKAESYLDRFKEEQNKLYELKGDLEKLIQENLYDAAAILPSLKGFVSNYNYAVNKNDLLSDMARGVYARVRMKNEDNMPEVVQNYLEEWVKKFKRSSILQREVDNVFRKVQKIFELSNEDMDVFASIFPDDTKTRAEVIASLSSKIEQLTKDINEYKAAIAAGTTEEDAKKLFNFGAEDVEKMEGQAKALDQARRMLGYIEKEKGGGSAIEKLRKQIQLVEQLGKDYEEMWKKFGKKYADDNIRSKEREAAFAETGLNLGDFAVGDKQIIIDNLKKLEPFAEKLKGGMLELMKAQTSIQVDVDWEVKEDSNEELARYFESLFGDYELTLELEKLNVPKDLASKLFGFDAIDLADVRNKALEKAGLGDLQSKTNEAIFDSEGFKQLDDEVRKQVSDTLKKVSEKENKEQEERMEKYIAFSRKAMSERAKIKLEELQTIEEIEKTFAIKGGDSEEIKAIKLSEKTRALAQARKDASDALQKLDWEAFKSSNTFNNIFDDLEHASDEVLKNVIQQLKDFKNQWKDMPFEQMRQVVDLLNKAESALEGSSNPFVEGTRLNKEIRKDGRTTQEAQLDIWRAEQLKSVLEDNLSTYELFDKVTNGQIEASELSTEKQKEYVEWQKKGVDGQQKVIAGKKLEIGEQDEIINKSIIHLNNIKKQKEAYEAQADAVGKMNQMAQDLHESFKGLHEALGGDSDSPEAIFAEMGMSVANSVASMIQLQLELQAASVSATAFGVAMNTALGVIGWINMAISALTAVITAFTKAHDNKREKQIQKELDLVERLGKLYEKLEKQIEAAYNIDTYEKAFQNANDNLVQQIQSRERMIELEKDNKKTDWDKIKEYDDEIEELLEQQKELESQRLQELGGIGGDNYYKDAAQSFADAWLEAFYETGDGLTALEEEFDEVMKNLVKKQALQRVAGALLQPLFTSIDTAVENDGVFDEKEFSETMKLAKQIFPDFNEKMKKVVEEMGMTDWAGKNAELGSLSAGIQGVSEETANVLASYMNTIRFYVADSNTQLKALVAAQGIDTDTPNPMLSQLLVIAEQTRAIRDMFESVIGRGGNNKHAGAYLKVDMG